MQSIEEDYTTLEGLLPKQEYAELDDDALRQVLRIFNDPALQKADGDVFGRIYEYFLTQFADQKAHDNGEFFTPVSLVETIVNFIEPTRGKVIDPACGSGGMFVQSAHFVEAMKASRFMIYLLAREDGFRQNAVTSMVGSSGRQRVQNSCFDKFMVSVPPKEIATEFDQKAGPMFNQISALLSSNQRLAKARDLLLPRLMDGRLPIPE